MKNAFIRVFSLALLVSLLVLLPPHVNKMTTSAAACQTYTAEPPDPCYNCCTNTSGSIPVIPFATGVGVQSLQLVSWSCGQSRPGGCSTACSGETYQTYSDSTCCVAEGGKCSTTVQCCGNTCTNGVCVASTGCPACPHSKLCTPGC